MFSIIYAKKLLLIGACMVACGCVDNRHKQTHYDNIPSMEVIPQEIISLDVEDAKEISEADFFSKYVKHVDFVSLDSTKPLYAIEKLNVTDHILYALSQDKILVFNDISSPLTIKAKEATNISPYVTFKCNLVTMQSSVW